MKSIFPIFPYEIGIYQTTLCIVVMDLSCSPQKYVQVLTPGAVDEHSLVNRIIEDTIKMSLNLIRVGQNPTRLKPLQKIRTQE